MNGPKNRHKSLSDSEILLMESGQAYQSLKRIRAKRITSKFQAYLN